MQRAGLFAIGLMAGCAGDPVGVTLPPVLEVWSEVEGEVYAEAEAIAVGPGRAATVFVGDGERRLTFRRGPDTVRTPPLEGPAVRLDPFLRAAGFSPTPTVTRTASAYAPPEFEVLAGGWIGGGRFWPAIRRSGLDVRWEAGATADAGVWVFLFRPPDGPVRLGLAETDPGGDDEGVTISPEAPVRGRVAVGVDAAEPVPVEIRLVVDDVVTGLRVAQGWSGQGSALEAPSGFGPGIGLAAHVGWPDAGATLGLGRTHRLPPEQPTVLLPGPVALEPMAPEPRTSPPEARPLEGAPGAVYWTPPDGVDFWGVIFEDGEGCTPGRHAAFEAPTSAFVERPALLADAALLRGAVGGFSLAAALPAFESARGPVPQMLGAVEFDGRRGYALAGVDACAREDSRAGSYAVLPADVAPCAETAPTALLLVDTCGRTLAPPALDASGAAASPLRCGRWAGDVLVDGTGRALRTRSIRLPDGRPAYRVDHPDGDRVLVPGAPATSTAPADMPRGRWYTGVVTTHLERPDFPGVPLLGTETRLDGQAMTGGIEGEIAGTGRLTLHWPGAVRIGRLAASPRGAGVFVVRPWVDACPDAPASATVETFAAAGRAGIVYAESIDGPPVAGAATRRVLTARLWR